MSFGMTFNENCCFKHVKPQPWMTDIHTIGKDSSHVTFTSNVVRIRLSVSTAAKRIRAFFQRSFLKPTRKADSKIPIRIKIRSSELCFMWPNLGNRSGIQRSRDSRMRKLSCRRRTWRSTQRLRRHKRSGTLLPGRYRIPYIPTIVQSR